MNRIAYLDGFRGLAIILVVLYHAYARYPSLVPYGDKYTSTFIIKDGFLGVQLFFLLSGFVILMTLEKTKNYLQFLKKRWLRLFPAMLIVSLILFPISQFVPDRPKGIPNLVDLIPGLTFIDPTWFELFTESKVNELEGTFWSLYVEVKYYLIVGGLYFLLGKRKAIIGIFSLYLAWVASRMLLQFNVASGEQLFPLIVALEILSLKYFGWFTTGSLAYLYHKTNDIRYLLFASATGLVSLLSLGLASVSLLLFASAVLAVFLGSVYFDALKKLFANRPLIFMGFISYPLYLIHENLMIAWIIQLGRHTELPHYLLPVIPILVLGTAAFLIAKIWEPALQRFLKKLID